MFEIKSKLKATTLIEVVVASIIMLIIFSISMDIVSKLLVSSQVDSNILKIESEIKKKILYYNATSNNNGIYINDYQWGKIKTSIVDYNENLYKVTIVAIDNHSMLIAEYYYLMQK